MLEGKVNATRHLMTGVGLMLAALGNTGAVFAQDVPRSFVASPEIYKVLAENGQYRLIEGVWQPGQRSQFHMQPVAGFYYVTECTQLFKRPDGWVEGGFVRPAGSGRIQSAMPVWSVENVGKSACRVIMFEPK